MEQNQSGDAGRTHTPRRRSVEPSAKKSATATANTTSTSASKRKAKPGHAGADLGTSPAMKGDQALQMAAPHAASARQLADNPAAQLPEAGLEHEAEPVASPAEAAPLQADALASATPQSDVRAPAAPQSQPDHAPGDAAAAPAAAADRETEPALPASGAAGKLLADALAQDTLAQGAAQFHPDLSPDDEAATAQASDAPAAAEAPAAEPEEPGFLERVRAGNAVLKDVFPTQTSNVSLPNPLDFNSATLLLAPAEGAHRLLITFGGNTGYLMLPPPVVMEPGLHVLAVRDPTRCFALCGLPGLGNTYEQCLNSVRRLILELDVDEIYCAGVSAGGYPALRYGLDLRANGVLAFSTPTTLDLKDDEGAPLSRYPQLSALYRRKPDIPLDLARSYRAARHRPRASLVFSPSNERDSWLAHRMADIEGVDLEEVSPEADHRVFLWLNTTKGIQPYFDRLWAFEPVVASPVLE